MEVTALMGNKSHLSPLPAWKSSQNHSVPTQPATAGAEDEEEEDEEEESFELLVLLPDDALLLESLLLDDEPALDEIELDAAGALSPPPPPQATSTGRIRAASKRLPVHDAFFMSSSNVF